MIAKGVKKGGLYALEELQKFSLSAISNTTSTIWHQSLGHANSRVLNFLKNKELISVSNWKKQGTICIFCQMGKSCKLPFNLSMNFSQQPLEKLHCDLWGPAPVSFCQKFKYYSIIIDDSFDILG